MIQKSRSVTYFSNINWAAYLLGGFWGFSNRFFLCTLLWFFAFSGYFISVQRIRGVERFSDYAGVVEAFNIPVNIAIVIICYTLLNVIAAYLALKGNNLLSKRISEKNLLFEKEEQVRMVFSAQQHRMIVYGLFPRLYFYSLGVFTSPILAVVLSIIDVLTLAAILALAIKFHDKGNELWPLAKFNTRSFVDSFMQGKEKWHPAEYLQKTIEEQSAMHQNSVSEHLCMRD